MRYPRHMTLELTAKCNSRCPYCYCVWHEYPALAKPELDADGWKANLGEAADMFVATALSGASAIQVGPVIFGGRAASRRELMISRKEWEEVKRRIRALPDAHVPYTFCDEFICECRAGTPKRLVDKWGDKNRKPCPAGKSFGVIGPNCLYRTCLHSLPQKFCG